MRKLIGLGVSAVILGLLYASLDTEGLARAIHATDTNWLIAGILFVIPLSLLTAWRFSSLVDNRISFLESNRLILAASTLNLFLPSKLGDLAKGHVMSKRHGMDTGLSYATVVLEKALDMMSLLLWGVFGLIVVGLDRPAMLLFLLPVAGLCIVLLLLILPLRILPFILETFGKVMPGKVRRIIEKSAASWQLVSETFWQRPTHAISVIALSVVIWGAHLFQFWLFSQALHGNVPILENAAFATLSILVGLLPFTFAGVGTRDAAIIFFYAPYLSPESAALLGILATLRYVIPAIAGAPFVGDFIGLVRSGKKKTT
ncbi:lysylphosphatidylglycerol synthase transmembrane domain-containing protein [Phyllobacterium sp. YR531]|uniref:lysylphosphatidylglycerol synthase transmembrane domain-containing protein n=1 Tax=Phyllobacterium sp. YR531 TaxID=1144343 RepID=UPI00026FAA39|nr:lysylphosphatidylglycerol synthase transmembrane domain-containing protein [Phyllobacterium sp. YR531]EJN00614.1 hypothetical protein PMI41_03637 [Phyllobacterium sp. YR531]